MKRAIAIRHVDFEDLGSIAASFREFGYEVVYNNAGVDLRSIGVGEDDILVILGGPIGAYEEAQYPFLLEELRLIDRALRAGCRILGICLGAQLLARALGARVYPGASKEIGIAPIQLTAQGHVSCLQQLGPSYRVLHWHGDTFDLPTGAECLASTALTPHQAFSVGSKILGLQFHIEAETSDVERWLIGHACELSGAAVNRSVLRADLRLHLPDIAPKGRAAIEDWLSTT